jgi:spermidine/putrescine ABC transporter ATP-binding subunit
VGHVELSNVRKDFGDLRAVNDISIEIERGEFFTIVGPSGCGKSTTLRLIAGFEELTAGRISIGGSDVDHLGPHERNVGLVFQNYALFPHMTVAENVAFGLRMQDVPKAKRRRHVEEQLSLVDLPGTGEKYPHQLSGGQQQRVALARALVIEPDVLLLDEPLSNLDQQLRDDLQLELKRIQNETGVTTIHVTHDQEEAMTLADRMCVLRDGRVEQIDSPQSVYNDPRTEFVSTFVGRANTLEARVLSKNELRTIEVRATPSLRFLLPESASKAHTGTVVIRPDHIKIEPSGDPTENETRFTARIESRHFRGETMRYTLTYTDNEERTVSLIARGGDHDVGAEVEVGIDGNNLLFYPEEDN